LTEDDRLILCELQKVLQPFVTSAQTYGVSAFILKMLALGLGQPWKTFLSPSLIITQNLVARFVCTYVVVPRIFGPSRCPPPLVVEASARPEFGRSVSNAIWRYVYEDLPENWALVSRLSWSLKVIGTSTLWIDLWLPVSDP